MCPWIFAPPPTDDFEANTDVDLEAAEEALMQSGLTPTPGASPTPSPDDAFVPLGAPQATRDLGPPSIPLDATGALPVVQKKPSLGKRLGMFAGGFALGTGIFMRPVVCTRRSRRVFHLSLWVKLSGKAGSLARLAGHGSTGALRAAR